MGHKRSRVVRYLPQELVDHVISFLAYDAPALKACSLVCTTWSAKSTLLLFKTLPVEWELIQQLILSIGGQDRVCNAVQSLHLGCYSYCEESCEVTIRQLREGLPQRPATPYSVGPFRRHGPISTDDLVRVISLFPRLKIASLYNLRLSDVVVTEITPVELQLQKLVLVNIWEIEFYPTVLARIFNLFKSVGSLKVFIEMYTTDLGDTHIPWREGDVSPSEGRLSIGRMSINGPSAVIFDPLHVSYRWQDLTRLDVVMNTSDYQRDLSLIRRFVERSTALEEFCLDVPFDFCDTYEWLYPLRGRVPQTPTPLKLPDFSSHSHLHTIHIRSIKLRIIRSSAHDELSLIRNLVWAEYICMLASASSTLRVVCLHAKPLYMSALEHRPLELEDDKWAMLGKKLATFPSLRHIYVVLYAHAREDPARLASAPVCVETAERLASAMPPGVRAKLAVGVSIQGQGVWCPVV